jgi:HTH-type transcriptional regulator, sugar sensing transcriptional regulator
MYEEQLIQLGLSKDQAKIYEILLKNGELQASAIKRHVEISRPLVYKVLGELLNLGLVEKKEDLGKTATFSPAHPSKLQELVENKKKEVDKSADILDSVINNIASDYNLISGKPGIRFFSGIEGIKKIYQDILLVGQDFYLIRPKMEPVFSELVKPVISDFVKIRLRKKMKVTALTPDDIDKEAAKRDSEFLFDRTWVPINLYNSPVEINIYGNKVAILSYAKELVGIIIESPQIAESMKQLFTLSKFGASNREFEQKETFKQIETQ